MKFIVVARMMAPLLNTVAATATANLTAAGEATVERGTETYPVTVREVAGDRRDRIFAEQALRYPGFADYALKAEGIRKIPVLELVRS
jgi:F420H(2)-dependent quinone reductase